MPAVTGTTVVRRQLGRRMRQARQDAGMTLDAVVDTKILSKSTLQNIEAGRGPTTPGRVLELARVYGLDNSTTQSLYDLAIGTKGKGWWEDYFSSPASGFGLYLGLESSAATILIYSPDALHGLLQTAAYARAVTGVNIPPLDDETIDQTVEIRLKRQRALFGRATPPGIRAVIAEGVLTRQVGGPEVMAAQIAHLHQLAARGRADVRVLPGAAGAHAAMGGPFTVMGYGSADDPTVVYVETMAGSSYFEKPDQVQRYTAAFDSVYRVSKPIEEYTP
jgi:transcriptional regulator with XRE-family HTH domain